MKKPCNCASHEKTATDNQEVKGKTVGNFTNCKEKTATNNQWASTNKY